MTSVLECAGLALAAYSDLPQVAGWRVVQTMQEGPFFAAHLSAPDGRHVLTFRGTDDVKDIAIDDVTIGVLRGIPPQAASAAASLLRVQACAGQGARLFVTGHSLGGFLGAYVAALSGVPVVTFNAPGVSWPAGFCDLTDLARAIHVRAETEMLTLPTAYQRLRGRQIRVQVPCSWAISSGTAAALVLSGWYAMAAAGIAIGKEIYNQHKMANVLAAIASRPELSIDLDW